MVVIIIQYQAVVVVVRGSVLDRQVMYCYSDNSSSIYVRHENRGPWGC